MRKIVLVAVAILIASASASFAYAQTLPQLPQLPALPQFADPIVQQDFQLFQKLDIGGRFGITFKPHVAVCTAASAGSANCNARVITDKSGAPDAQTAPTGYGPAQFLEAYGLSGVAAATPRPVIAIVDAYDDPSIASDLATYDTQFGIPQLPNCSGAITSSSAACFEKVNEQGKTSYPASNAGWSLEISLDVEIAHATCENCSILLVEASSNGYGDLMTAENEAVSLGANVVSNSWGGPEFSGETSYDSYFNHSGVAFVASAGDSGYGVEYPAASPYVTAVGGTSLYLSNGSYNSEVAWSGTGSGCSAFETKPSWQADSGCSKRTVVDVSAYADPNTGAAVYDSVTYDGVKGWFQVGGTSLASPLIAATYALAGIPAATTENSLPYLDPSRITDLHDVASGSNGNCGSSYLCTAIAGYDGPTGLGTPNGTNAFTSPSSSTPPPPAKPTVSISASPASITPGQSSTLTWSSANATSCTASNAWSGAEAVSGSQLVTPGATGTYTLACTGAGGTTSNSATVTVTAPASFSLSAKSSSLTVSPGGNGSDTITVTPAGGFTGSVTLSVLSGLPSGASASFNKNPAKSTSNLSISTNRKTAAGTYTVTVEGKSGSLSATTTVTFNVQ